MGNVLSVPTVPNLIAFSGTKIADLSGSSLLSYNSMNANGLYTFRKRDSAQYLKMMVGIADGIGYIAYYGNINSKNELHYIYGSSIKSFYRMTIWENDSLVQSTLFGVYRKGYYIAYGNFATFSAWTGDLYINPSDLYNSFDDAIYVMDELLAVETPITYIPVNSELSGPSSAASGQTVNVSVSFPDGYIYQETGVQVYNQNGTIPFTYSDGQITFTMP